MVDVFLLAEGLEQIGRALLELIRINERAPNVLKGDAALLAGIVVWVTVLWALSNVMAWLLAALADVALWQITAVCVIAVVLVATAMAMVRAIAVMVVVRVSMVAMAAPTISSFATPMPTFTMSFRSLTGETLYSRILKPGILAHSVMLK